MTCFNRKIYIIHVLTCTYRWLLLIKYSKHARERMVERGISVNEAEEAIRKGSKELQKPDKILHHYKYFVVVTKKIKNDYFVITVKSRW